MKTPRIPSQRPKKMIQSSALAFVLAYGQSQNGVWEITDDEC